MNKIAETSFSNLEDHLKCFICFERARAPYLCPNCSKMACQGCFQRWLTERTQCPHCRTYLISQELVRCRFFEGISEEIDKIHETRRSTQTIKPDQCFEHLKTLDFFCNTCNEPMCADCGLLEDKHRGHEFTKLDIIYDDKSENTRLEIKRLRNRLHRLRKLGEEIDENIKKLKHDKECAWEESVNAIEDMENELKSKLKSKLLILLEYKNHLLGEDNHLESLIHEMSCLLDPSVCTKSKMIQNFPKYEEEIKAVHKIPVSHFFCETIHCNFSSQIVPPWEVEEMEVKKFLELVQNTTANQDPLFSSPLKMQGLVWKLKVYPRGNGSAPGEWLSVFVELIQGFSGSRQYQYKIELICYTGEKNKCRTFSSNFEEGECWGYNRFVKFQTLVDSGYISSSGSINFRFSVRSPNYFYQSHDLQAYIKKLENGESLESSSLELCSTQLLHSQEPVNQAVDDITKQICEQTYSCSTSSEQDVEAHIVPIENSSASSGLLNLAPELLENGHESQNERLHQISSILFTPEPERELSSDSEEMNPCNGVPIVEGVQI